MINQITRMRLADGTEVAFVDWADQPLWSKAYMLEGFTDDEVDLFTYVRSQDVFRTANCTAGPTANEGDTNIAQPGQFADTEEMLIYAVKVDYFFARTTDAAPTDVSTLELTVTGMPVPTMPQLKLLGDSLTLRLWVSDKVQFEAPLAYFNTGYGPMGQGMYTPAAGATTQRSYASAGLPSQDAVRSLAMPVYIGGTETWRVALHNFTGGAVNFAIDEAAVPAFDTQGVCRVTGVADGLYKRPVS